ncbi:MAG: hypothetical protein ACRDYF_00530 [Acidimicrobiia bacterium]
MLGEQIGEERGQVLVRRVLPSEGSPQVEVTFEARGQLCGVDHTDMGTYVAAVQPDGSLQGEGQGLVRGAGNEVATWRGAGAGRLDADGGVTWRGAIYYQSQSPAFARLNGIAVVYEYHVDASGKTEATLTEWK